MSKLGKGSKKNSSQGAQATNQPQPSTSSTATLRNTSTRRIQVQYSACSSNSHFRKDRRIITVLGAGQGHMLQTFAGHQHNQVGIITSAYIVVASTTPPATELTGPMTTGRNPGHHGGTSTVSDQEAMKTPNIWETSSKPDKR